MRYKLYETSNNDITGDIIDNVLKNRGIKEGKEYLSLNSSVIQDYNDLDNMGKAVECFLKHINNNGIISIIVDSDPDGYCSAAMIYKYIKRKNKNCKVNYIIHKTVKNHVMNDVDIPDDTELLIIPDAGTNDTEECKKAINNMDIIILDHHKKECDNPYAIIVNNQMSERYTNKQLCGAGIVYRFLQSVDDYEWDEYADETIDLCALANISDNMDIRSKETKYLIDYGLKNINNKFLKAMIKAQEYSMKGVVSIHNIQWYITPVINGLIRIGTFEERDLLFRAFLETDEVFDYKKRGTPMPIKEDIYDRAVRICKNCKTRQDKRKQTAVPELVDLIKKENKDSKIILANVTGIIDSGLTGITAIQIANIFKRPCILVQERIIRDEDGNSVRILAGSGRNCSNSPIKSLNIFVENTGVFKSVKGHDNAFGVELDINGLNKAQTTLNKEAQNIIFDNTVEVDYVIDSDNITVDELTNFIYELSKFDSIIGTGIEEPKLVIKNMSLTKDEFKIIGKNEDAISFNWENVKFVQFKCDDNNELYKWLQDPDLEFENDQIVSITLIGKAAINDYNGVLTPQIIIEDISLADRIDEKW